MSWLVLACAGIALAVFTALAYRRGWRWTGFSEKTLWDWLQLFVIPLALAGLAFLLNNSQSDREQRREDERAERQRAISLDSSREEALRAYLTQMSGLMLDRKLLRSRRTADVRAVARTLTLTVVRRVDGERKGIVVRFLVEAHLASSPDPKVALVGADLRSADLEGAFLEGTDLTGADLRGANLSHAFAIDADFRGAALRRANLQDAFLENADLRRAHFPRAILDRANLRNAHLRGADLRRARLQRSDLEGADLGSEFERTNLTRADLRGANLRGANLRRAIVEAAEFGGARLDLADLRGASLWRAKLRYAFLADAIYNSKTRWPRGFDPGKAEAAESR